MTKLGYLIRSARPVRWMKRTAQGLYLRGFEGSSLYETLQFFGTQTRNRSLNSRAAAISFNFLMSIPPFSIFLFTLVPFVPMHNLEKSLYELAADITPNYNTFKIVQGVIHDFMYTHHNGLLSISFIVGFFYSSNAVMGIIISFSKDLPGFTQRKWYQNRLMALRLTCFLVLLFIIVLALLVMQGALLRYVMEYLGISNLKVRATLNVARWSIIVLLFFSIIAILYHFGPSVEKRWRYLTPGAVLATVFMILVTVGFSWYVNHFNNYNKIYGSVGTIMILMLYIFLNSFVLLVGFELNAAIRVLKEMRNSAKAKGQSLPQV
ncbi:membrane protein [Chitinophaga costaii]|uniref:Membrane protein n=1 Tax=Chitinophaga costaii TaxID=1335309 RepID=A0A1C4ER33_9BACT|nr:YihY/virulence factor BrkB family protein [Chitinophaga costaii]PUZ22532.1 YihY/virulence factor BrkB family protein [Chitinophaga costaii]SCC46029.1 membrane protein [Chitinophaga costaii]